jgi:hypothetical protein
MIKSLPAPLIPEVAFVLLPPQNDDLSLDESLQQSHS